MPEGQIQYEVEKFPRNRRFRGTGWPVQIWLAAPKTLRSRNFGVFCVFEEETGDLIPCPKGRFNHEIERFPFNLSNPARSSGVEPNFSENSSMERVFHHSVVSSAGLNRGAKRGFVEYGALLL